MNFVAGYGHANCDIMYQGVPRLPREGEEVFSTGFDILPGGGVPATLTILSRLGVPTRLATFLGKKAFSSLVEGELKGSGVDYQNLYEGDGEPVLISSTILTPGERTFVTYSSGETLTGAMEEQVCAAFAGAKVVEMQVRSLELYRRLRRENPQVVFVLDTGWHDDLSLDRYRDYLELADYYTPNRKEALKITGTASPEEAIQVLARFFPTPIVKLDREGCLLLKEGALYHIPPLPDVEAKDATGAGDAFLSGLLYGLYHDRDIADCVLYGNITGGTCVREVGCLTARVSEAELLAAADRIKRHMTVVSEACG